MTGLFLFVAILARATNSPAINLKKIKKSPGNQVVQRESQSRGSGRAVDENERRATVTLTRNEKKNSTVPESLWLHELVSLAFPTQISHFFLKTLISFSQVITQTVHSLLDTGVFFGPNIPLNKVMFTHSDIQISSTVENPLAQSDNGFDTAWRLFAPAAEAKGRPAGGRV